MNISKAIEIRKSTRAFIDKDVDVKLISKILEVASHASSGSNMQPWNVAVVSGSKLKSIKDNLLHSFLNGVKPKMDYQYYPLKWNEKYKQKRQECGYQLYSALNITKGSRKKYEQWARNYIAYDAPIVLFFFIDDTMEIGAYIDYGIFLQSIMLAAIDYDLATCPQASLAEYPDIIRKELNYENNWKVLCGMAVGYEDKNDPVNQYRTNRDKVDQFTKYFI